MIYEQMYVIIIVTTMKGAGIMKNMPLIEEDTDLSLEALQAYFQTHDFSTAVARYENERASNEERQLYSRIRNYFEKAWIEQMGQISKQNNLRNFSKKAPVRCLEQAEEKLVAGTVMEILADEALCQSILDTTLVSLEEPILEEIQHYAQEQGKNADALTDEELAVAVNRFSDRFLGKMVCLLEQTQQVPAILNIGKAMPAAEDFNNSVTNNFDRLDYLKKWYHHRTKVGAMLELDDIIERSLVDKHAQTAYGMVDRELAPVETDAQICQHILNAFIQSLEDSTDREILYLRADGLTQKEIAQRLGYKNHSAVGKRLSKLQEKCHAFLASNNEISDKTFKA